MDPPEFLRLSLNPKTGKATWRVLFLAAFAYGEFGDAWFDVTASGVKRPRWRRPASPKLAHAKKSDPVLL